MVKSVITLHKKIAKDMLRQRQRAKQGRHAWCPQRWLEN